MSEPLERPGRGKGEGGKREWGGRRLLQELSDGQMGKSPRHGKTDSALLHCTRGYHNRGFHNVNIQHQASIPRGPRDFRRCDTFPAEAMCSGSALSTQRMNASEWIGRRAKDLENGPPTLRLRHVSSPKINEKNKLFTLSHPIDEFEVIPAVCFQVSQFPLRFHGSTPKSKRIGDRVRAAPPPISSSGLTFD